VAALARDKRLRQSHLAAAAAAAVARLKDGLQRRKSVHRRR
jgi:hypothetical protein